VNTSTTQTQRLLAMELGEIAERLHAGAGDLKAAPAGGDFLDVAQDLEHQELARLSATRLTERARRLRIALNRMLSGEYGVCAECEAAISPTRLRAIPDATTCVTCQEQLERGHAGRRGNQRPVRNVRTA
jgi:RNA polymerase-binding transcription factor DksA